MQRRFESDGAGDRAAPNELSLDEQPAAASAPAAQAPVGWAAVPPTPNTPAHPTTPLPPVAWPTSYPPPPEFYQPRSPASSAAAAPNPGSALAPGWGQASPPRDWKDAAAGGAAVRRCQWCGMANPPQQEHCVRCGAAISRSDRPDYLGAPAPYPPFAPDGRVDPTLMRQTEPGQASRSNRAGAAVGVGATAVAAVSKLAVLAKFAIPVVSALASLGLYAALFGWQFGLGILVLLFIHEMGHAVVIRAKGIPASLPIFIPLLGAAVIMRRMPHNAQDEAEIAIAGPLAGALAGVVCFVLYNQTGFHLWLALAYFSFFLNLLNLIPVSPLDGGRIAGAISKWFWPVGLVVIGVMFYYTHSIILLIVGWLGLWQAIDRFRRAKQLDAYYRMPAASRVWISLLYFGLAAVLALGMLQTQHMLVGGLYPYPQ